MTQIKFDFSKSSMLVTGGAQGIGYEIVRQFLQAGGRAIIWDYSQKAIDVALSELAEFKDKLSATAVDITQRDSCAKAALQIKQPINVLVNNAGITRDKSFVKMSPEEWDAVIQTNLTGLFNVTKSLMEKFDASTSKRIINISSVVGLYGNFGQANYAAAKAGVIGYTKTLAKELGRKGFCVNAIAPGFIQTAMTGAMPKEVLEQMAAKVPVARLGLPQDIASACLFLSSEAASYINGTVLSVDGGIVL